MIGWGRRAKPHEKFDIGERIECTAADSTDARTGGQCPASLAPVNLSLPRLNVGENHQALLKILTKAIYRTHLSLLLRTKITSDEFLASYFIVASITQ